MRNLREVLTDDHELDLEGWVLYRANGVSADGRTIVGDGLNPNGGFEAWIAVLDVSPATLPGDFNHDATVDAADYVVWRKNFGMQSGAISSSGDGDNDGDVDGADYLVWQRSFGQMWYCQFAV